MNTMRIRDWVERTFTWEGKKIFLELGAHRGEDTEWLSKIPDVTVYAFEPDPRNEVPAYPNVHARKAAIGAKDGLATFILSDKLRGEEWTYSSSLRLPKAHRSYHPDVSFGEIIQVPVVTLDTFCAQIGLTSIDFIWADIQGAEGDMVAGGRKTLAATHYLYTEFSNHEMYEGQLNLKQLLAMLPQFSIISLWDEDVLLRNMDYD